jgi:hypothetical protein
LIENNQEYLKRNDETFFEWKLRLIEGKLDKSVDLDWSEITQILGLDCSGDHLRKTSYGLVECAKYYREKQQVNALDKDEIVPYKSAIEINKDGTQTSDKLLIMAEEDCKNVEFLLKAHGYDPNAWELVNARNNIWNVYSKKDGVQTLYSSKIVVRPKAEFVWTEEYVKKLFENLDIDYTKKKHE